MKKLSLLKMAVCSFLLLIAFSSQAQDVTGKNFINAGIGLGSFNLAGTGGLPISISVEHGFHEKISAGIYVGYIQKRFGNYWKYKFIIVGARGSYHFNELLKIDKPNVDLYGGATLYYRGYKYKYSNNGESSGISKTSGGNVGIAFHVGGRYMFAEKIGAFAEVGYGISPLQLGLTVQL